MKNCKTCEYRIYVPAIVDQETGHTYCAYVCNKDPLRPQKLRRPIDNCTQYEEEKDGEHK